MASTVPPLLPSLWRAWSIVTYGSAKPPSPPAELQPCGTVGPPGGNRSGFFLAEWSKVFPPNNNRRRHKQFNQCWGVCRRGRDFGEGNAGNNVKHPPFLSCALISLCPCLLEFPQRMPRLGERDCCSLSVYASFPPSGLLLTERREAFHRVSF